MTATISLPPAKKCATCGETFRKAAKLTRAEWAVRKYCSVACRHDARAPRHVQPPRPPVLDVLVPAVENQTWRARAACADRRDVEVVAASSKTQSADAPWMEPIKALCDICPVTGQCLEYGRATKSEGVWGGVHLVRGRPQR